MYIAFSYILTARRSLFCTSDTCGIYTDAAGQKARSSVYMLLLTLFESIGVVSRRKRVNKFRVFQTTKKSKIGTFNIILSETTQMREGRYRAPPTGSKSVYRIYVVCNMRLL